jgi:hypothetical protein
MKSGLMSRFVVAPLVLVAALLAGCSEDVTEVVVTVDAESTFSQSITELRVVVRGAAAGDAAFEPTPARDVTLTVGEGQSYAWPIVLTVAPRDGETSRRWSVEATATNAMNATATVRVRGSYVSGRTLRVSLELQNSCVGVICSPTTTCREGACVDAELSNVADAGHDSGVSSDAGMAEGGVPRHCAAADLRIPNADAGTLDDDAGVRPVYPVLATCATNHTPGQLCTGTSIGNDICFTGRDQGGPAYCRLPCSFTESDGGVRQDDPLCQSAVHPDSHCTYVVGSTDPDRSLCSIPCNPFDDVGCVAGQHCVAAADTERDTFTTDCKKLDTDVGSQFEPCTIVNGLTYPTVVGCAPGYVCGYDDICGVNQQGYVCMQLCDPDPDNPRLTCPADTA